MTTVLDYIRQNDNIKVEIDGKETRDDCDPFCVTIWVGMLHDIPEKLRGLEVINEGYRIGAKINCLEVFVSPWKDVWKIKEEFETA